MSGLWVFCPTGRHGGPAAVRRACSAVVTDGLDVVAVGVEEEGAVVPGVVLRALAGSPFDVYPASTPARQNASTAALSAAAKAMWTFAVIGFPSATTMIEKSPHSANCRASATYPEPIPSGSSTVE